MLDQRKLPFSSKALSGGVQFCIRRDGFVCVGSARGDQQLVIGDPLLETDQLLVVAGLD